MKCSWTLQNEDGVSYQDRVAFACHFLDDKKVSTCELEGQLTVLIRMFFQLHLYLTQLSQHLVTNGCIDGLFVTGVYMYGIVWLHRGEVYKPKFLYAN